MDPASIFTLIVTVSDLSSRRYGFFQALHDAPEEVREYLDYHHRLEMRNSSRQLMEASAEHRKQLVEVTVEQRKILNAVEEHREILECLREERAILKAVHEQQMILQAAQQTELRLREAEGVSCPTAR